MNDIYPIYAKLKKALQEECNAVRALCGDASNLKTQITVNKSTSNLPNAQIDRVLAEADNELPAMAHELNQSKQAEDAFCRTHNLQNKAANPNPTISALQISIGVFVDAFVNSSFLYNAHLAASPSAALLVSVLISLTNGVTSAFAGFFIGRYRKYGLHAIDSDAPEFVSIRERANKQFKVFLWVISFFILTVGLIRSTESLDHIRHSLSNYYELLVTPEAVFLVLMNICVSVFSYHKGRTGFAHPYGDYSEFQEGVIAAQDALHECYTRHVEAIEDICEAFEDDIGSDLKSENKSIEEYNAAVTEVHAAHRELQKSIRQAESHLATETNRALDTRSVSTGQRQTMPEGLLEQFSFADIDDIDLPAFYVVSDSNPNTASLQTLRTEALNTLSAIFQQATQFHSPFTETKP